MTDNAGEEIYSIPIKSEFSFKKPNIVILNQREPMLFEIGMRSGMSGGATLNHNFALVGINTASAYDDISLLDKVRREKDKFMMEHSTPIKTGIYSFYLHTLLQRKRVFLNIGISLTLFILNNLRTNDMYPGARCISTAIEPHKKWIEEWRERFQQED